MDREDLTNLLIKQLRLDLEFEDNDLSALFELVGNLSDEDIIAYLPEDLIYEFEEENK